MSGKKKRCKQTDRTDAHRPTELNSKDPSQKLGVQKMNKNEQ